MPTNTIIQKKAMLKAMEASLGVVTVACKTVGIDRTTHYDWMNRDPEYKAAIDSLQDVALDFAESQLHKMIGRGREAATIFYLKTKGKHRGYVERNEQEMTITNHTPFTLLLMTDDADGKTDSNPESRQAE